MTTDNFFKWILPIITVCVIGSLALFIRLLFLERSKEEAFYGIISMTICLIVILAVLLLHLKFSGDAMLKLIEIGRKENIKQLEKRFEGADERIGKLEKSLEAHSKKFDNAKE